MKHVMLESTWIFSYNGPDEYLNYERLIHLARENHKDVVVEDEVTGEEVMRIGKGFALGHNS
jgi:hypothetical protein